MKTNTASHNTFNPNRTRKNISIRLVQYGTTPIDIILDTMTLSCAGTGTTFTTYNHFSEFIESKEFIQIK